MFGLTFAFTNDVNIRHIGVAVLSLLSITISAQSYATEFDPFAILKPNIVVNADDRRDLDARQVVLKILPAKDHELAVFAAGALDATGTQLSDKINDIAGLKRSVFVPEVGRFSNPPVLSDLDGLSLDDVDLNAIRECRARDCALKLSSNEIDELRRVVNKTPDRQFANTVNREFRRIILERVKAYLANGLSGIPTYATGHTQVDLDTAFNGLLKHAGVVQAKAPQLGQYLTRYPDDPSPQGTISSFLYWSKEKYAWKPIISVTHVTVIDPRSPDVSAELVVASKEVFSTRYTSGALVLTLLLRGTSARAPHYLVYVNRTWVDGLHAFWRPFVNQRIRSQARRVFTEARARIEGTGY